MRIGNTNDSDDNMPLGIVQRMQGNTERRNVRPASSCASNKKDDSGTIVVSDIDSEIPADISRDYYGNYDENDGSPSHC